MTMNRYILLMIARFAAIIALAGMLSACAQTGIAQTASWDTSFTGTANSVPNLGPSAGIF